MQFNAVRFQVLNKGMASLPHPPSALSAKTVPPANYGRLNLWKFPNSFNGYTFPYKSMKLLRICCTDTSPWEPAPITYASSDEADGVLLKGSPNIFETLGSGRTAEVPSTNSEELADAITQSGLQLQYFKWPMWLLGPSLLLATGMVPTLWLPVSSIFLGPNIASLLSLTGLDCIYNLGASLFLLMADSCARPKTRAQPCSSKAPFSYRLWNMFGSVMGFIFPLMMFYISQKGFLQPQLPFISFAVLLGPYLLLLLVQMITEMLTWHWQSPVWLVTPIVYEGYRMMQLMRGLKLGAELSAPAWMMHTVRGLVCWWVLVLGVQVMRIAWYAGFTAHAQQKLSSAFVYDE